MPFLLFCQRRAHDTTTFPLWVHLPFDTSVPPIKIPNSIPQLKCPLQRKWLRSCHPISATITYSPLSLVICIFNLTGKNNNTQWHPHNTIKAETNKPLVTREVGTWWFEKKQDGNLTNSKMLTSLLWRLWFLSQTTVYNTPGEWVNILVRPN